MKPTTAASAARDPRGEGARLQDETGDQTRVTLRAVARRGGITGRYRVVFGGL